MVVELNDRDGEDKLTLLITRLPVTPAPLRDAVSVRDAGDRLRAIAVCQRKADSVNGRAEPPVLARRDGLVPTRRSAVPSMDCRRGAAPSMKLAHAVRQAQAGGRTVLVAPGDTVKYLVILAMSSYGAQRRSPACAESVGR